jgi:hypothetical protein
MLFTASPWASRQLVCWQMANLIFNYFPEDRGNYFMTAGASDDILGFFLLVGQAAACAGRSMGGPSTFRQPGSFCPRRQEQSLVSIVSRSLTTSKAATNNPLSSAVTSEVVRSFGCSLCSNPLIAVKISSWPDGTCPRCLFLKALMQSDIVGWPPDRSIIREKTVEGRQIVDMGVRR